MPPLRTTKMMVDYVMLSALLTSAFHAGALVMTVWAVQSGLAYEENWLVAFFFQHIGLLWTSILWLGLPACLVGWFFFKLRKMNMGSNEPTYVWITACVVVGAVLAFTFFDFLHDFNNTLRVFGL